MILKRRKSGVMPLASSQLMKRQAELILRQAQDDGRWFCGGGGFRFAQVVALLSEAGPSTEPRQARLAQDDRLLK
jgi:hypothetical protein